MLCPLCADQTVISEISSFYLIRPELDTMKSTILLLVASLMIILVSGRRGLLMRFNCVNTNIEFCLVPDDDDKYSGTTAAPQEYRLAYDCNEDGSKCSLKTWVWVMCVFIPLFFITLCLICLCCGWYTCACLASSICCCCCCIE